MAGGLSALVVSGCGNADSSNGLQWTSTAPAFTSTGEVQVLDTSPHLTVTTAGVAVTAVPQGTTTTAAPGRVATGTTVSVTSTSPSPVVTIGTDAAAVEEGNSNEPGEDVPTGTGAEGEEGMVFTHPGIVMSNDYWEELGFPDPAAPPVEDPERIRYAEDQIRGSYFRWYDAIYRKHAETLWEAVATEGVYEGGLIAMERMTFTAAPTLEGTRVKVLHLYVDHPDCLVAAFELDITAYRDTRNLLSKVIVMWPDSRYGWRRNMTFGLPAIYGMWWSNCFIKERAEFP